MKLIRSYLDWNVRAFEFIKEAMTATWPRRIATAIASGAAGVLGAHILESPVWPVLLVISGAIILAVPLIAWWQRRSDQRRAAELLDLASRLDAMGMHDSAEQLRDVAVR